ncbi:MAG: DUF1697 domain-containing protein [Verrucomicrobiaceae bacterium]|nr:MAG: DUF1697 domain-containing protein [Verrucomicrobiaceae bacterium]
MPGLSVDRNARWNSSRPLTTSTRAGWQSSTRNSAPESSLPRYIAFLRAINVGGRTVKMESLARLFRELEFQAVETFIASGNVIFTSSCEDPRKLESLIEEHLQRSLGFEVKTFLRTTAEVAAIARCEAIASLRRESAIAVNVAFLTEPLNPDAEVTLMALRTEIDDFHVRGREVYWLCQKKQSESKFSNAVFEKALKVRATFRGLNTVWRLAERYANPEKSLRRTI